MKELTDAFRKLKERDVDTFAATVISVDKEKGTCSVSDDEITYTNVRLSSIIKASGKSFFLYPKVGSSVLVSPINEDLKNLYVESYSEIEQLDLKIENVEFKISSAGFLLKKQNESLKALLADFITACQQMQFMVNTTGTATAQTGQTVSLVNNAQFETLKTRFNNFLNDV